MSGYFNSVTAETAKAMSREDIEAVITAAIEQTPPRPGPVYVVSASNREPLLRLLQVSQASATGAGPVPTPPQQGAVTEA